MKSLIQFLKSMLPVLFAIIFISEAYCQRTITLLGILQDKTDNTSIPFATVILRNEPDSTMITGTTSNPEGRFELITTAQGNNLLEISHMGYDPLFLHIDISDSVSFNTGIIYLQGKRISLDEVQVMGERILRKVEGGKITYHTNNALRNASVDGVDILKYIPGLQVDLMNNISLEGSRKIIIMVNGKERDIKFVRQLNPGQIDKIEVEAVPSSQHNADVTGVLNIVLKEKETGMSGNLLFDVPASTSETYLLPNSNLQYVSKNIVIQASYLGEINRFDISETSYRTLGNNPDQIEISAKQHLNQNDWSHRFNLGIDYRINGKNMLSFFGYLNPFSQEFDGKTELRKSGNGDEDYWSADKEDTDRNLLTFYSAYYKRLFEKGREMSIDAGYHKLNANNSGIFTTDSATGVFQDEYLSYSKPMQHNGFAKIDYTLPVSGKWKIFAGARSSIQFLKDGNDENFSFRENVIAAYGNAVFNGSKLQLSIGMRIEESKSELKNEFQNQTIALLPNANISYNISPKQKIRFSYRRSLVRPWLNHLNPSTIIEDPYMTFSGNPMLQQEYRNYTAIDYPITIGENHFTARIFFSKISQAIDKISYLSEKDLLETGVYNAGSIHQFGFQVDGSLKPNKMLMLNPYFRLFEIRTLPNAVSEKKLIQSQHEMAWESGLSMIVSMRNNFSSSLIYNYSSPVISMQRISFSDALYFIALEKSFKRNYKIGITSALPFARSFNYHGYEIKSSDFTSRTDGKINLSTIPLWFRISYQFSTGRKVSILSREKEEPQFVQKKGFGILK
ncbi:MAG: TonB-dependent receptor [Lentimicrobium sp.]|nr:TonB-dependent receptor [Lentimicrobium sp.]